MKRLPRRRFLKTLLAGSVALPYACAERESPRPIGDIPSSFIDRVTPAQGHVLRRPVDPAQFSTAPETTVDALVIGGGVSGLAACWKLRQAGVQRVLLVELVEEGDVRLTAHSIEGADPLLHDEIPLLQGASDRL